MLTQERHSLILQVLQDRKAVTVTELSKELDASESTIRRDLITLHEMGKLNKVHGGATVLEDISTFEADVETKSSMNVDEKNEIGRYAASLIKDDDFVYIDAGTTTLKLVDYISNTKAVYITNGFVHAKKLVQKGCKAYVIGGELKLSTEALVGAVGIQNLKKYNFTKGFLGTNGISLLQGVTTPEIEEGLMKKEAANRSYMTYILADHTKFGKASSVTFASLDQVCIITDFLPDEKYRESTIVKEVCRS
ncbi:DeoR/GlpR family DNA-binding transcription regulator [Anaerosporobacter faecicola]|uniref:DeoR/GlpR family DNA-binding transcription regulator n=1 Tax=Anaerosporobacter faecicola TaxID=2718714 RepID=UPI00143AA52D|nr:DeoR/GlpR family DNA-binding transcription regulator [Anaerosporobacter faecicola]